MHPLRLKGYLHCQTDARRLLMAISHHCFVATFFAFYYSLDDVAAIMQGCPIEDAAAMHCWHKAIFKSVWKKFGPLWLEEISGNSFKDYMGEEMSIVWINWSTTMDILQGICLPRLWWHFCNNACIWWCGWEDSVVPSVCLGHPLVLGQPNDRMWLHCCGSCHWSHDCECAMYPHGTVLWLLEIS